MRRLAPLVPLLLALASAGCSPADTASSQSRSTTPRPGDHEITLAWDPSPDSVSYYVAAVFEPGVPVEDGRELRSVRVQAPATTAKIVVPGGPFVVAVKACNAQACSAWAQLAQPK